MTLDEAIGITAQEALRLRRFGRGMSDLASNNARKRAHALSLVMWAAKEKNDRDAAIRSQQRPRYKACSRCGQRTSRHFNYRHRCGR